MSYEYSEDGLVEQATQDVLKELGWDVVYAWQKESFGDTGLLGRENKSEVILKRYLFEALKKFNPDLPDKAYNQAIEIIVERSAGKLLVHINDEYNNGKDINATQKAFDELTKFLETLNVENSRAIEEGLNEETLAIFDLLKKENLKDKERDEVKKVAVETLEALKAEKLKVERWRESTQIKAQIKNIISEKLVWLPQESYTDEEVEEKPQIVFQHIYTNYSGGGKSVYEKVG
ncbi:MAG: DUF3387 domain-containing protein [Candidatus Delongbacteria bacterium]|nr:DUF3387 domain-containing protein [Candidatus Delongbacteria bacterium]